MGNPFLAHHPTAAEKFPALRDMRPGLLGSIELDASGPPARPR